MFTKDSIKQFLKPDWRNILFFFLLSIIFLIFFTKDVRNDYCQNADKICFNTDSQYVAYGFPLIYADHTADIGNTEFVDTIIEIFFPILGKFNNKNYPNFFLDLIFWYLISCLLVFAWDRIRKKHTV